MTTPTVLSAKTEYAALAMIELSRHYASQRPVPVRAIADAHDIPPQFLVQILLQLKSAGLVQSVRGAAGGYQLVDPPETISLGDVVRVTEGEAGRTCEMTSGNRCRQVLGEAWQRLQQQQQQLLDDLNLGDLAARVGTTVEPMYYI